MKRWQFAVGISATGALAVATAAFAVDAAPDTPTASQPAPIVTLPDMEVIAHRLGVARQEIQPSLGATIYQFTPEALQEIPQGENAPLNQVLLQAPGIAQDSFGQVHLRG